jgi:hypothetical protein
MKKLNLNVDALHIESFTTDDEAVTTGTVHGQGTTNYGAQTCNGYPANTCIGHGTCFTCQYTLCGTCDGVCTQAATCNTCNQTCDQHVAGCGPDIPPGGGGDTGPIWSSAFTACGNCQQSVNEVGTCIVPCTVGACG